MLDWGLLISLEDIKEQVKVFEQGSVLPLHVEKRGRTGHKSVRVMGIPASWMEWR